MNSILAMKSNEIYGCKPHAHNGWEIILQLNGNAGAVIGDESYCISEGDIMVIPPGVVHFNMSDNLFQDIYVQGKELDFSGAVFARDKDGSVRTLMEMLLKAIVEKENNYKLIADALLEAICLYIKKELANTGKTNPYVDKLKNEIYANLANADFNIVEEMRKIGFNPTYFRRCFKEIVGKPPLEYMTQLRINRAKILLRQDNFVSVKNVAYACGFNDNLYFSTCFKKHVGISPIEYRKNRS